MSLAVKLLRCNASCKNCYENKIRENDSDFYQEFRESGTLDSVMNTLRREIDKHNSVTIHGGEPLCLELEDLETLLDFIHSKKGSTGIQTNLLLLKDEHIELFKRYKTHVGISLDPNMNVRDYKNDLVYKNIARLKDLRKSIISVLWKDSRRNEHGAYSILDFIHNLYLEFGIKDFRMNAGIAFEDNGTEIDNSELEDIYFDLFEYVFHGSYGRELLVQPIRDIIDMLLGSQSRTCIFNKCDPFHTTAEVPIFEDGSLGNCLKVTGANDGIKISRSDKYSTERYELLKNTDCKDCRYWLICYGGCPGEGVNNDWRNKSRFCEAYYAIFERIEKHLKNLFPNLITVPDLREEAVTMDDIFMTIRQSTWRQNQMTNVVNLKRKLKSKIGQCNCNNSGHGDVAHGDRHGDHTDGSR